MVPEACRGLSETLENNSKVRILCATVYIIMCLFTYTCSQKHINLSDGITM